MAVLVAVVVQSLTTPVQATTAVAAEVDTPAEVPPVIAGLPQLTVLVGADHTMTVLYRAMPQVSDPGMDRL